MTFARWTLLTPFRTVVLISLLAAPFIGQDRSQEDILDGELIADASFGASPPVNPVIAAKTPAKGKLVWPIADDPAQIKYSRKGLEIKSRGGNYTTQIRWRTQLRFSNPFDSDPRGESHFERNQSRLGLRRARFKMNGHAIRPWLTYSWEHDLLDGNLLNLFTTIKTYNWLQFQAGQWKPEFSRERRTSSAKQQFIERSIVNREFTIDRQAGFQLMGRLMPGKRTDSSYFLGVFTGTGRSNGFESGGHPMYVARYQWNMFGEDPGFSSGDVGYSDLPAASLALAGVMNRSRYTRYSSSSQGGHLDGFEMGEPGQYSLKQLMGEFFLRYRGLSIQNEVHWKGIYDNINAERTNLRGTYAQAGYFPHALIEWIPRPLEAAYRYAFVDPHTAQPSDLRQEHSLVVNWFFEGHNNKLSLDVSRVSLAQLGKPGLSDVRFRIQWDVHF